jgi:putative tricarboxylic transport membrane protein
VLAVLGVVALVEAARLRDDWQGARLMPAVVGVALLALSAAHLRPPRAEGPGPLAWPGPAEWGRVGFVFGILVLYVLGLPPLGFLPATVLFVLILVRFIGRFSWPRAIALSLVIAAASHLVFRHWLGMPLPTGMLGV